MSKIPNYFSSTITAEQTEQLLNFLNEDSKYTVQQANARNHLSFTFTDYDTTLSSNDVITTIFALLIATFCFLFRYTPNFKLLQTVLGYSQETQARQVGWFARIRRYFREWLLSEQRGSRVYFCLQILWFLCMMRMLYQMNVLQLSPFYRDVGSNGTARRPTKEPWVWYFVEENMHYHLARTNETGPYIYHAPITDFAFSNSVIDFYFALVFYIKTLFNSDEVQRQYVAMPKFFNTLSMILARTQVLLVVLFLLALFFNFSEIFGRNEQDYSVKLSPAQIQLAHDKAVKKLEVAKTYPDLNLKTTEHQRRIKEVIIEGKARYETPQTSEEDKAFVMFGVKQELYRFFNFDDEEEGALEFIEITREIIADRRADVYYIFQALLLLLVSWVKFMLFYKGTYFLTIGGLFAQIFNGGLILDCTESMVFSNRFLALFTIAILNDCQFVGHRDWSKAWQFSIIKGTPLYIALNDGVLQLLQRQLVVSIDDIIFFCLYLATTAVFENTDKYSPQFVSASPVLGDPDESCIHLDVTKHPLNLAILEQLRNANRRQKPSNNSDMFNNLSDYLLANYDTLKEDPRLDINKVVNQLINQDPLSASVLMATLQKN